jgi:hypothetical protein
MAQPSRARGAHQTHPVRRELPQPRLSHTFPVLFCPGGSIARRELRDLGQLWRQDQTLVAEPSASVASVAAAAAAKGTNA